jgi:hypothetical protein
MTAAADGEKQIVFSREVHGVDDVGDICATGDQPWLLMDHPVVHLAGFIVILVAGFDQSTTEICFEIGDSIFVRHIQKEENLWQTVIDLVAGRSSETQSRNDGFPAVVFWGFDGCPSRRSLAQMDIFFL